MAGIGFFLRRLAGEDNISGVVRAYLHSAVVAVGPWIMLVISMSSVFFFTNQTAGVDETNEFLAIVIYNFFFALVLAGPIYVVSSRYIADCLFLRNISPIPGIFIVSMYMASIPALIISTLFYVFWAKMTPLATLMSIINFVFLAELWLIMLYLACLKNYRAITSSWLVGMLTTILCAAYLGSLYQSTGMIVGFNIGLIVLLALLRVNILVEYPFRFRKPKEFKYYMKHYQGLFWGGFFLYASMWIDKVVMWGAPEAKIHLNNLHTYPVYDGGMYLSYLTIIPVMALFIFSLETNFYETYIEYINLIEHNVPLALIESVHQKIFNEIKENGRSFMILQGSITLIVIILAPTIFDAVGFDYLQLSIFRQGAIGAFFATLNLFIVVIFCYFNSQENVFWVAATMFFTNTILTFATLRLGFPYYGFGYSTAMLISFFVGANLMIRFLNELNYHIFITNIVKRQSIAEGQIAGDAPIAGGRVENADKI